LTHRSISTITPSALSRSCRLVFGSGQLLYQTEPRSVRIIVNFGNALIWIKSFSRRSDFCSADLHRPTRCGPLTGMFALPNQCRKRALFVRFL
jgi:hypothetical protein